MGWLLRLFNWRAVVEATAQEALNGAVEKVKQEISEGKWTKTQQVSLKEGVDLLSEAAMVELREHLNKS